MKPPDLSLIQRKALTLIGDLGEGAADLVHTSTIRSLRRKGLVSGCFDRLALTPSGELAVAGEATPLRP